MAGLPAWARWTINAVVTIVVCVVLFLVLSAGYVFLSTRWSMFMDWLAPPKATAAVEHTYKVVTLPRGTRLMIKWVEGGGAQRTEEVKVDGEETNIIMGEDDMRILVPVGEPQKDTQPKMREIYRIQGVTTSGKWKDIQTYEIDHF